MIESRAILLIKNNESVGQTIARHGMYLTKYEIYDKLARIFARLYRRKLERFLSGPFDSEISQKIDRLNMFLES